MTIEYYPYNMMKKDELNLYKSNPYSINNISGTTQNTYTAPFIDPSDPYGIRNRIMEGNPLTWGGKPSSFYSSDPNFVPNPGYFEAGPSIDDVFNPTTTNTNKVTAAPVQTSGPTNQQPWSPQFMNIPGIGSVPYFRVSDLNWGPYENNPSEAIKAWQDFLNSSSDNLGRLPRNWESILKTEDVEKYLGGDDSYEIITQYIKPELTFRGNPSDYGDWGVSVFRNPSNWRVISDQNDLNKMELMVKTGRKERTFFPYVRQGDTWVPQTQGIRKEYLNTDDFGPLLVLGLPLLFSGLASAGLFGAGEAAAGAGEAAGLLGGEESLGLGELLGPGVAESFPVTMPSAPIMSELAPLTEIGAGGAGAAAGAIDPWLTEPGFAPPVDNPIVTFDDPWFTEPGFEPPVDNPIVTFDDPWFTEPGFEPPVSPGDPWFTEPGFDPPVNPDVPDPWMTEPGYEPSIPSNPTIPGSGDLLRRIGQIGDIGRRLFGGGSGGGNQMGGNANGLLGLLSAIYGARQSKEYADMLRQIARQMQEQASPYINKLRESYENPNAYLESPEMQAILSLEANRLAGIDAAQGRLSNDINRTAKLQQLAQSRLADYRRGLQQSIEKMYQPMAVASLFREAAGRQANAWQGIPQFFGSGGSFSNVWNDIKNIIDTGKDIWDVISGWWD